jgi:hypothetical protein
MRLSLLIWVLTSSVLTVASSFVPSDLALAGETKFICGTWQGAPATIARTSKGDVPVIRWVSDHFNASGFTAQKRCQMVSAKFQQYYQEGTLKYLTTGRKNGNNVVCVAQSEKGACKGQLFTLKPGSNPGETLKQLMAVRSQASGATPVNESSDRVYISIDRYLEEASVANSQPTNSPASSSQTPTEANANSLW